MVYCGKPSRGCQMCRTRRIKCDETKPTCLQCQKSRRQCPGYKDDFDIVFRNETQATERRARRAGSFKKAPPSSPHVIIHDDSSKIVNWSSEITETNVPDEEDLSSPNTIMTTSPVETLSIPIEEQAPCFFLANFVLSPAHGAGKGYFDFLAPLMAHERPDSQLRLAFDAVSMASLANRPNVRGRGLMPIAAAQYAKALKATNLALQNPIQQKTDQTLAAILLLGFFETVASERTNATAWYSHVDGAVQLVKLRGKKQLRTKVGQNLFQIVRTQMTINAMTSSKVPILGEDWWTADAAEEDFPVFITKLNIRLAVLRGEVNAALTNYPRTPEYFQKVNDLIKRAQAMEKTYLAWEERLPAGWHPKTVAWVDTASSGDIIKAEACPGKVDIYPNIWAASIWNSARIARLYISGTIVRCAAWVCSPVDYRTTPEYATAARLCVDLATDVIASIPYQLGWKQGAGLGINAKSAAHFRAFEEPHPIASYFVIWPLFAFSGSDFVTDSQRAWIKGRLAHISDSMGINHARVLASFQLRLPSMIIRRDNMGHTPPTAQMIAAAYLPKASPSHSQSPVTSSSSPSPPGQNQRIYTLTPLQQREAMQREAYERERASLIKKASNSQGESVERLMANYLSV